MLLRPRNLSAGNMPGPASGVTDSLAFTQKRFAASELLFRLFALGDVVVSLENCDRIAGFIALQSPTTCYQYRCPVAADVDQFPFPLASLEKFSIYLVERRREGRL